MENKTAEFEIDGRPARLRAPEFWAKTDARNIRMYKKKEALEDAELLEYLAQSNSGLIEYLAPPDEIEGDGHQDNGEGGGDE